MKVQQLIRTGVLAAFTFAPVAWAGPGIIEGEGCLVACDAGSLPDDAQVPAGSGTITSIQGRLSGTLNDGPGDFEDMYLIRIDDPQGFQASTLNEFGGAADFNTQLYLFNYDGLGLLANDDGAAPEGGNGASLLLSVANDGTGQTIPGPGLYYLAISGFNDDPLSGKGLPIFNKMFPGETSGPDGPGGSMPITAWSGPGEIGDYVIAVAGVSFAVAETAPGVPAATRSAHAALYVVVLIVAVVALALRGRRVSA
jgi:hypothetical protein